MALRDEIIWRSGLIYILIILTAVAILARIVIIQFVEGRKWAEMGDILGLFAPRPVVVVAGCADEIFPLQATQREFRRLKKIYTAAGAPRNCKLAIGNGGHRFYAEPGWKVMEKFLSQS